LGAAANYNREEVKEFLAAQMAAIAGQSTDQGPQTDWGAAIELLDKTLADMQLINDDGAAAIDDGYQKTMAKLEAARRRFELVRATKESKWNMDKAASTFDMGQMQTANGPRVPITKLQEHVCITDALGQATKCEWIPLRSMEFQQGKGYHQKVLVDSLDEVYTEVMHVDRLYRDIPR
jgi:hypothetical protein